MTAKLTKYAAGLLAAVGLSSGTAVAQEVAETVDSNESNYSFDWGGDLRVRHTWLDNIPVSQDPPGVARGGYNAFWRFRTRVWGQANIGENIAIKTRALNEFREYSAPDSNSWEFPSETLLDLLYIDFNNMLDDTLNVRLGRQELIYGTGKIILEGTPKDGSRSIFFDAAKFSYTGLPGNTIDVLGIYNTPEADLAIGETRDRDITGLNPYDNDMTSAGGAIYLKNNVSKTLPFEAYYVVKNDSEWDASPESVMPESTINTVGMRLMPKSGQFTSSIEIAGQLGEYDSLAEMSSRDQEGYMLDATVRYQIENDDPLLAPQLGLGFYMLSGDDPDSERDEGWDPMWARYPQYSELYVYAFDYDGAGRWSNVNMPFVDMKIKGNDYFNFKALAGWMGAMEADGPGGGKERGFLVTMRNDFKLPWNWTKSDSLSGHITLEMLKPGDYYMVDDWAYFARAEICYNF